MTKWDWDRVYEEIGEVQKDVLPVVKKAVAIFKKRNYKKILDLACGTGRHTIYLASNGFPVYGIDISKKGVEITRKKAKELGLQNVKLKVHSMSRILKGMDSNVLVHLLNIAPVNCFNLLKHCFYACLQR